MAATYNFNIEQGNTYFNSFEYKNEQGTIINLTNYQARISIQPTVPSGDLITYISDNEDNEYRLVVDGDSGKITWQLPSTTTQAFAFTTAIYDFDLKAPNEVYAGAGNQIIKLLKGTITIIPSNISTPQVFVPKVLDEDECVTCE